MKVKIRLKYNEETAPWSPGSRQQHGVIDYFMELGLIILDSDLAVLVQSNWLGETCRQRFKEKTPEI